jgi:hypothetical protein
MKNSSETIKNRTQFQYVAQFLNQLHHHTLPVPLKTTLKTIRLMITLLYAQYFRASFLHFSNDAVSMTLRPWTANDCHCYHCSCTVPLLSSLWQRQKATMVSTAFRCVSRHIPLSENIIRSSMLSTGCMIKQRQSNTPCMWTDDCWVPRILNIHKLVKQRL